MCLLWYLSHIVTIASVSLNLGVSLHSPWVISFMLMALTITNKTDDFAIWTSSWYLSLNLQIHSSSGQPDISAWLFIGTPCLNVRNWTYLLSVSLTTSTDVLLLFYSSKYHHCVLSCWNQKPSSHSTFLPSSFLHSILSDIQRYFSNLYSPLSHCHCIG